jgi:hypothetical protein
MSCKIVLLGGHEGGSWFVKKDEIFSNHLLDYKRNLATIVLGAVSHFISPSFPILF